MTTKSDIVAAVAASLGKPQSLTKDFVDASIDAIATALVAGEKVQIAGLGVFEVKATKARTGRNPQTGQPVPIAAGKKLAFKAASDLKGRL